MTPKQAKKELLSIAKTYFGKGTMVIFANQSRTPKPDIPLVTIALSKVRRALFPPKEETQDSYVRCYPAQTSFIIDLFTNGEEISDDKDNVIGTEDTSVDEMLAFKDYLESEDMIEVCEKKDIAIGFDGDVVPLTGIVNDTTYEYRARLTVILYFTHTTSV